MNLAASKRELAAGSRASSGSTASSARRPTSGIRTWSTTTTRWTQPATPGRGLPPQRRPHRQGHRVHRRRQDDRPGPAGVPVLRARAPRTPRTTSRGSGPTGTRAASTWATRRRGSRSWPGRRSWASCRRTTELPPINPIGTPETRTGPDGEPFPPLDYTKPWDGLSADERRLFARMAEVYAGFLSHADAQIGRLLDHLEEIGQLDNTLIFVVSRQRGQRRGRPERLGQREQVLQRHPRRPRRRTWPCSTSSAGRRPTATTRPAGRWPSTPRSRCGSATRSTAAPADPCIVSWPAGIAGPRRGPRPVPPRHRHRAHRAGLPRVRRSPSVVRGVTQIPIQGVSMRYSFAAAADAPSARQTQFYSMLGTRGDLARRLEGRHHPPGDSAGGATTRRTPGSCTTSRWTAPNCTTSPPRSRSRLAELIGLWFYEAGANHAFPLDDRSALEIILTPAAAAHPAARPLRLPARRRGDPGVRRGQRPQPRPSRSARRSTCPTARAQGVLFAHGSRFGGHACTSRTTGCTTSTTSSASTEQRIDATEDLPTGRAPDPVGQLRQDAARTRPAPRTGTLSLFHGDRKVGEGADPDPARQVLARPARG